MCAQQCSRMFVQARVPCLPGHKCTDDVDVWIVVKQCSRLLEAKIEIVQALACLIENRPQEHILQQGCFVVEGKILFVAGIQYS